MPTGYSRSPKLLKGALIHFSAPMLIPVPSVIIFQYNPETMTRKITPWSLARQQITYDEKGNVREDKLSVEQLNQLSQPFDPEETFSLVLEVDATDALEFPDAIPPPVPGPAEPRTVVGLDDVRNALVEASNALTELGRFTDRRTERDYIVVNSTLSLAEEFVAMRLEILDSHIDSCLRVIDNIIDTAREVPDDARTT